MAAPDPLALLGQVRPPNSFDKFDSVSGYEWAARLTDAFAFVAKDNDTPPPNGNAFIQADYVVFPASNAGLTQDRLLTAGTGITIVDGGAKGPVTISSTGGPGGGGLLKGQAFTANGTWTPPAGVTAAWVTMVGGGGGGATRSGAVGAGGGGAGELVENMLVPITGPVTITIGVGGVGAAAGIGSTDGGNGSDTSFGTPWVAKGGLGAISTSNSSGAGGGARGALSSTGLGALGSAESPCYFGGSSGGGGSSNTTTSGFAGGGSGGFPLGGAGGAVASTQGGGGGGAATIWGLGGAGGNGGVAGVSAATTSYGAGGGGAGGKTGNTTAGGNGTAGYVLVCWIS
jgi:hypothetical protein